MAYEYIVYERRDNAIEITLNRPDKRNPLSFEMIDELRGAFQEAMKSDARGILLGSTGPVFSAGHSFHDMLDQDLEPMRELMNACVQLMQLIHSAPQPVLAKVQGPAVGAGCQLALTCDLVVASEAASFQTPGGSAGWFCFTPMVALTRAVGRKFAFEMLITGDPVSAERAYRQGMINRVVPADRLDDQAQELMQRAMRGSREMKALGKQAFYTQVELDEMRAFHQMADMMALTGITDDPQERMRAFVEKRKPVFKH